MGAGNNRSRRGIEFNRYRRTNRTLAAIAVIYIAIGAGTKLVAGAEELFPFSSWSLFSMVPNEARDYTVRIIEVDGHSTNPPVNFEDARDFFGSAVTSHAARMTIERLGRAVERGDHATAETVRAYFEALDLRGHTDVRYEVIARRYDPLERWRDGKLRSMRVLVTFLCGRREGRP